MTTERRHRALWLNVAAVVLMVSGIAIAFTGHNTLRWSPPPIPPAWAAGGTLAAGEQAGGTAGDMAGGGHLPRPMARSVPVRVDIPRIKVAARVIPLGLNPDGTVAVPALTTPFVTSWYDAGPTPGQRGTAALYGHVDSAAVGPAVFYDLGNLRPGDQVLVRLRDGRTAVFKTYAVAMFPKAEFPTATVYGYTRWPTLRLVTCGGAFDRHAGHYLGNIVVFATYVGQLPGHSGSG